MSWPTAALGDVAKIVSGSTPKTGQAEYWDGTIPWATPKDLSKLQGMTISVTERSITDAGLAGCGTSVLPAGAVLLSSRAPIGYVAIAEVPMATNQGFKSLVLDPKRMDSRFVAHWLRDQTSYLQSVGNGATFKELSKATTAQIVIPVPPLEEQRRIAAILDQTDNLPAQRRRSLTLLDDLTQSIFLDTFGDPRAKLSGAGELSTLVDQDDRINYGVVQPGVDDPDGVPLIRVGDLHAGGVRHDLMKRISPQIEAQYKRSRIRGTEILISCVGTTGTVAVVSEAEVGFNVARAVTRIPISDPVLRKYVAHYLQTDFAQSYFRSELRTVSQPTLNGKQIAALPVHVPAGQDLDRFADRLQALETASAQALLGNTAMRTLVEAIRARAFVGGLE